MGLKGLQTKLSIQGVISGASDVSSAGTIKKFALGGFSDDSNGVVNTAFVAPLSYTPSTKNSSVFEQNSETKKQKNSNTITGEGEAEVNNKHAINSSTPEPLAIFSFTQDDVPKLQAAIYQAYVEDKCSLEFSKTLIKKAKQENESALQSQLDKVKQEAKNAQSVLDLTSQYLQSCLTVNKDLNSIHADLVKSFTDKKYASLSPDKLGLNGKEVNDMLSLLASVGISSDVLSKKSNTALMTQILYIASKQMTNGASPLILGEKTVYPGGMSSISSDSLYVDTKYGNDSYFNLKNLSLANNLNQSFVYGVIEDTSYLTKLNLSTLQTGTPMQKAAYLMALLANEMAVSTGLGRLENTQIGQSFASTTDYRKSFWGADDNTNDASVETTFPGSLSDYLVVSSDGSSRVKNDNGVLLFDGTNQKSTKNRSNCFDSFVAGSIRHPASKDDNKVQQFDSAQKSALSRYELGVKFFNILQCRDKNPRLLTPRGLFNRLLLDFSDVLSLLGSAETAKGQAVLELYLLSILGKESTSGGDSKSAASVIKRSLLSLMSKKALQLQYALDTADPLATSKESQKPQTISSSTKVTTTNEKGEKSTISVSAETQLGSNNKTFSQKLENPRLCLDEKELFDKLSDLWQGLEVSLSFGDLPISQVNNLPNPNAEIFIGKFYQSSFDDQSGLLNKLVKIYVDMCAESIKICKDENKDALPINSTRLTKNSQIDGTLLLSMLLEAACLLSSDFVNAKIDPSSPLQPIKKDVMSWKDLGKEAEYALNSVPLFLNVEIGENSKSYIAAKAISAIVKASNNDDLTSAFLEQNGNLVVPEIGSLPTATSISYDAQGQTTVSSLIDVIYDLVFERELPALCMSVSAAMPEYLSNISQKYIDISSQMLGVKNQNDDVKSLTNFLQTNVGNKFFSSVNDFSLYAAKRKMAILNQEILSDSGRNPKITLGELRCIQHLLNVIASGNGTNEFVVVAFPKDFVTKSLNSSYGVNFDVSNSLQDETMKIIVEKSAIFDQKTNTANFSLMIRSPFTSNSFSAFEKREPVDMNDILSNVIVDDAQPGYQFLQKKIDIDSASTVLMNELVSYLMRKLFSLLSSADLFADNISDFDYFPVDPNSANTAKIFAKVYGLDPTVFSKVFTVSEDGSAYINSEALVSLSNLDFTISNVSSAVTLPTLSFGEAELFYDLFETTYFQPSSISKRIFLMPVLDETAGFLMNSQNFSNQEIDSQLVTINGTANTNGIANNLYQQTTTKQIPSFDTYSVSVESGLPMGNR